VLDEPTDRRRARGGRTGPTRPSAEPQPWGRSVLVIVVVLAVLLPAWSTPRAEAATRTLELTPTAMSYTDQLWPTQGFADRGQLSLSHTRYATYLAYDLAEVSADRRILSAELVLHIDHSEAEDRGLLARYTSADWSAEALSALTGPPPVSGVVNGQEDVPPRAGAQVTLPLVATSGIRPERRVGLHVCFSPGVEGGQPSKV